MPKPKRLLTRQERWKLAHPWVRLVEHARRRCADKPGTRNWAYYGNKGIKCFLTSAEVKELWDEANAWKMLKPSIDRKDSNGHYTKENCKIVEFLFNSMRALFPGYTEAPPPSDEDLAATERYLERLQTSL